jgi:hypothetical protein
VGLAVISGKHIEDPSRLAPTAVQGVKRLVADSVIESPQRERLPFFKSRISMINQIKTAIVTGTDEWFVFSEDKGVE